MIRFYGYGKLKYIFVFLVAQVQIGSIFLYYQQIPINTMKKSTREEEKPERHHNQSSVLCKHCGRLILADNYLIHQARCALMSSRVYQPEQLEKEEIKYEKEIPNNSNFRKRESKKEEKKPIDQPKNNNRDRSRIFDKRETRRQEDLDKIPCHFCGYLQTLAELDTHPLTCAHRQQECPSCHNKFPKSLMGQHHQVCRSANQRPQEQNRRNPRAQRWMQWMDEEQEEDNYNPFGNFSSFFMDPRRRSNNFQQNGMTVIQSSDGRGNIRRQVFMMPQPQQGFLMDNRRPTYQNPHSPFTNFFALLELMAGRHAHTNQNQGLTKEQIKNLKRMKYQGNNLSKKEGQKDLCTICYCEFQNDEKLVQLKCKHVYHEQCITKWVQKTAKCPVCKAPQTNRPVFEEEEEYM